MERANQASGRLGHAVCIRTRQEVIAFVTRERRRSVVDPPGDDGGPPLVLPWTLVVPASGWEADLEYGAPLPRVGEQIEFIADDGTRRSLRVETIIHTLQHASSERPPVRSETRGPNSLVNDRAVPDAPGLLRPGLPRVVAVEVRSPRRRSKRA